MLNFADRPAQSTGRIGIGLPLIQSNFLSMSITTTDCNRVAFVHNQVAVRIKQNSWYQQLLNLQKIIATKRSCPWERISPDENSIIPFENDRRTNSTAASQAMHAPEQS